MPFEVAADLVQRRCVFLKSGFAFVPKNESFSMVLYNFKIQLEKEMQVYLGSIRFCPRNCLDLTMMNV